MKLAILTSFEMPTMLPYDMEVVKILENKGVDVSILIWDEIIKSQPQSFKNYDAILIRTIWDYFIKFGEYQKLLDILELSKVPIYNSVDMLRWNMNKQYLAELQSDGIDIIPTVFNLDDFDNNSFVKAISSGWEKMILKPVISGNSYHTFVINNNEEDKYNKLIAKYFVNRPFMLQEFIPEISNGEISTITFANGYSYSITKVPKKDEYRVQVDFGGIYHSSKVDSYIKNICDKIAIRFPEVPAYQRVDGLWRDGKFLIMEVELIEPDLYLNLNKEALSQWIDSLLGLFKV